MQPENIYTIVFYEGKGFIEWREYCDTIQEACRRASKDDSARIYKDGERIL